MCARVDLFSADLFGRHEVRRADDRLLVLRGVGHTALVELRQPEVEHLGVVAPAGRARDQNILRFEIAVNDAELVRLLQRATDLREQRGCASPRERAVATDDASHVEPADELHDQVQVALCVPEVEDLDRVRVMQARDRGRFALEPLHDIGIGREVAMQDLHRGDLAHPQVFDPVDDGHAAATDHLDHAIAAIDDLSEPRLVRIGEAAIRDRLDLTCLRERGIRRHLRAAVAAVLADLIERSLAARANMRLRGCRDHRVPSVARYSASATGFHDHPSPETVNRPAVGAVAGPGSRGVASTTPGVSWTASPSRVPLRAREAPGPTGP